MPMALQARLSPSIMNKLSESHVEMIGNRSAQLLIITGRYDHLYICNLDHMAITLDCVSTELNTALHKVLHQKITNICNKKLNQGQCQML